MDGRESIGSTWWKGGLFAALLSAAIPAATFVQGWMQKNRELALQERQQLQQIRLAYMEVMVEGGVQGMEIVADFIADTEEDPVIVAWASKQRNKARATADTLEKRLLEEEAKVREAESKLREAEEKAARAAEEEKKLRERPVADRESSARAEKAAEDSLKASAAVAVAEVNAEAAREKVLRSKETLSGKTLSTPVQTVSPKLVPQQFISPIALPPH